MLIAQATLFWLLLLSTALHPYTVLCIPGSEVLDNVGDKVSNLRQPHTFGLLKTITNQDSTVTGGWDDLPPVMFPPKNFYLSDGAWPAPHRSGYSQASSTLCGPQESDELEHDFLNNIQLASDPITLLYTNDNKYVWGVSWTSIMKIDRSGDDLVLVDYISRSVDDIFSDVFHGAYSLLSSEGIFYTAVANRIEAYGDDPLADVPGDSIMKFDNEFVLPEDYRSVASVRSSRTFNTKCRKAPFGRHHDQEEGPKEVIRALCMLYDGHLAFATNDGRVGVVGLDVETDFDMPKDIIHLGELSGYAGDLEVSNNIACDEEGGIYIVSNKLMHKVIWDGELLDLAWETEYNTGSGLDSVRLGEGSGSTPSLMGDAHVGRYVVITDAATIMNVVVFDASDGSLAATHEVLFGLDDPATTLSEQSILVAGWKFAIVNNTPREKIFGSSGIKEMTGGVVSVAAAPPVLEQIANSLPVIVGDAPYGVEQFEFNKDAGPLGQIKSTWSNQYISIPNGIPSMSDHTEIMYGIGKRPHVGSSMKAGPFRGTWTLEGIDWWTGSSVFYYPLGGSGLYNSVYAATEVGADCEIITGTLGGVVRIRPRPN